MRTFGFVLAVAGGLLAYLGWTGKLPAAWQALRTGKVPTKTTTTGETMAAAVGADITATTGSKMLGQVGQSITQGLLGAVGVK